MRPHSGRLNLMSSAAMFAGRPAMSSAAERVSTKGSGDFDSRLRSSDRLGQFRSTSEQPFVTIPIVKPTLCD